VWQLPPTRDAAPAHRAPQSHAKAPDGPVPPPPFARRAAQQQGGGTSHVRSTATGQNAGPRDAGAREARTDRGTQQQRAQNDHARHGPRQHIRERRPQSPQQAAVPHPGGHSGITPKAARLGRFAPVIRVGHPAHGRTDRIPAQLAWRHDLDHDHGHDRDGHRHHHHHARFVAWAGLVFWPYVYDDMFYYSFWPDAYDDDYWPYAYDDLIDGIYWATGSPYSDDDYAAPTAATAGVADGEPARSGRPARSGSSGGSGGCESRGIADWPFAKIERIVKPTAEQRSLLDALKAAASQAVDSLKAACPHDAALTPNGRLQAMIDRLQAAVSVARTVHAPLMTFYSALSDEQKARFNAIGPDAGPKAESRSASAEACPAQKPGLIDLPVERIAAAVRPADMQQAKLDALKQANGRAIAILQAACPDRVPQTPVGRLEAIETRLDAMIGAAKAIQPALQNFYDALTDEQKSRFNTLGQRPRRDG
jgi:hypothetical protein